MLRKSEYCRSDSKIRAPSVRVARNSLQVESFGFSGRRSSSIEPRIRNSEGLSKPRSSSDERKSIFNNWNTSRKSSLNVNEKKLTKDPRPLADKAYQKQKSIELIDYLKKTDFSYPINLSKLSQPSKKDFEKMFEHLAQVFEPSFKVQKIDEDATRILKNLCYRFIPNKSAFQYVARTNWPPLLGILLFLMDLGKCVAKLDVGALLNLVDSDYPQWQDKDEQLDFLNYVLSKYFGPTDEDDDREAEIFKTIIQSKYPFSMEDIKAKHKEIKLSVQETAGLLERIKEQKEMAKAQAERVSTYQIYFDKMKVHMGNKTEEYQNCLKELEDKESELRKLKLTLNEKQAVYDAQGFDGRKKLTYLMTQKEELSQKLTKKREIFKETQQKLWDAEMQFSKISDLDQSVREEFNDAISNLRGSARLAAQALAGVRDAQIRGVAQGVQLDIPSLEMARGTLAQARERREGLEEVRRRVDAATVVLKGLAASQGQKLQEVLIKNSELSLKITTVSSQESEMQRGLTVEDKQMREERDALEYEFQEYDRQLNQLRQKSSTLQKETEELKAGLKEAKEIKKRKSKEYNDYITDQEILFKSYTSQLEAEKQKAEACGQKVSTALESLLKTVKKVISSS